MIVVTVNQMEFHLVQNLKENYHHDHIPFNVKGKGSIDLSEQRKSPWPELQLQINIAHTHRHFAAEKNAQKFSDSNEYAKTNCNYAKE